MFSKAGFTVVIFFIFNLLAIISIKNAQTNSYDYSISYSYTNLDKKLSLFVEVVIRSLLNNYSTNICSTIHLHLPVD